MAAIGMRAHAVVHQKAGGHLDVLPWAKEHGCDWNVIVTEWIEQVCREQFSNYYLQLLTTLPAIIKHN